MEEVKKLSVRHVEVERAVALARRPARMKNYIQIQQGIALRTWC